MAKPTPEYYKAKADLCERLAIQQIFNGNTDMGMRNIMRMSYALAEIQLQEKEGRVMTRCNMCMKEYDEAVSICGVCLTDDYLMEMGQE
jgi:hypothetical protein